MQHTPEHDPLDDAPLLRTIRREDPFVVPEGFFDRFPQRVQDRIHRERAGSFQWLRAVVVRPSMAWASIVLLIGVLAWAVARSPGTQRTPMEMTQEPELNIAPEELLLADGADMDLVDELELHPVLLTEVGSGLTRDELVAYLEQDELPIELLIEEL